jgi:hypothetical protein
MTVAQDGGPPMIFNRIRAGIRAGLPGQTDRAEK